MLRKFVIKVCDGTACHVSDSERIIETIQDELNIEIDDTTEDSMFTLTTVACLGCCSLAPVIMINESTHGKLTPPSVRKLLKTYKRVNKEALAVNS